MRQVQSRSDSRPSTACGVERGSEVSASLSGQLPSAWPQASIKGTCGPHWNGTSVTYMRVMWKFCRTVLARLFGASISIASNNSILLHVKSAVFPRISSSASRLKQRNCLREPQPMAASNYYPFPLFSPMTHLTIDAANVVEVVIIPMQSHNNHRDNIVVRFMWSGWRS